MSLRRHEPLRAFLSKIGDRSSADASAGDLQGGDSVSQSPEEEKLSASDNAQSVVAAVQSVSAVEDKDGGKTDGLVGTTVAPELPVVS
mmetsp:Transcript_6244/g.12910  ORF Transcript_6244/g.12910 Transcript_6244/m.12910 type:complete len:88 (+) Transcript_6244:1-264(+)